MRSKLLPQKTEKKVKKGVDKREEARYNRRAVNEKGQPRDSR